MDIRGKAAAILLLVGGLAVGLGAFLPWVEVLDRTAAGTGEMIGWVSVLAGFLVVMVGGNVALSAVRPQTSAAKLFRQIAGPVPLWAGWAAWLVATAISVGKWIDIQSGINEIGVGNIGFGLLLQAGGSLAALAGLAATGNRYVEHTPEPWRPYRGP
jgi:hypothetical protein